MYNGGRNPTQVQPMPFAIEVPRPASATVTVRPPVPQAAREPQVAAPPPRETRASAPPMPTFFRNVRRRWVPVG